MVVTLQIGNTDNKLTQQEWSDFVKRVSAVLDADAHTRTHFFGGSSNWEEWQNVAWVFETNGAGEEYLRTQIIVLRKHFKQDSAAWSIAKTVFI